MHALCRTPRAGDFALFDHSTQITHLTNLANRGKVVSESEGHTMIVAEKPTTATVAAEATLKDNQGGIFFFTDGTRLYWGDDNTTDVVIQSPGGRKYFCADEINPYYVAAQNARLGYWDGEERPATPQEVREWAAVHESLMGDDLDAFMSSYTKEEQMTKQIVQVVRLPGDCEGITHFSDGVKLFWGEDGDVILKYPHGGVESVGDSDPYFVATEDTDGEEPERPATSKEIREFGQVYNSLSGDDLDEFCEDYAGEE